MLSEPSRLKKCRFEPGVPPAALPGTDPWLTQMPSPAPVPVKDQWLNQASPYATTPMATEWLNQPSPYSTTPAIEHGRDHPAPFTASPPGNKNFSYTSPYAAFSINQEPVYESATWQTSKQRTDQLLFISNAPTLRLDFGASAQTALAWQALTRMETEQHSLTQTVTDWYIFAKKQTAQHTFGRLKNSRYRTASLIGAGLVALMLIALFAQSGLSHQTLSSIKTNSASNAPQLASSAMNNTNNANSSGQQAPAQQQSPAQQQAPAINASRALVRISQLDADEYASQYDYNIWAYSTCSSAALTEVFNAYGHHYRIADVLQIENRLGEITPDQGLLDNVGIARTAAKFGFKTKWGNDWTLSRVLNNANAGHPVIVGWPPDRYTDGHIVVVTGGDSTHVYLADSSIFNRHTITHSQFMQWWGGFAAVVTPK